MKFDLPLDIHKEYIFTIWKDCSIAVFDIDSFDKYQLEITKYSNEKTKSIIRFILRNASLIEYENGWIIPDNLLSYINNPDDIDIIEYKGDDKSPILLIKNKNPE